MDPHEFKEQHGENPLQNFVIPLCPNYKSLPFSTPLTNMQPLECFFHANPSQNPEWNTNLSNRFLYNSDQFHAPFNVFSPSTSSVSPVSTSDDKARENRMSVFNEKRLRRVISNRESARRSRMRKKKLIEELQSQVDQIQTINHQLSEKLFRLLESNHQILQENAQLKEKVSSLQIVLTDLMTPLRGPEDVAATANMNSLRAEASTLSIHH